MHESRAGSVEADGAPRYAEANNARTARVENGDTKCNSA